VSRALPKHCHKAVIYFPGGRHPPAEIIAKLRADGVDLKVGVIIEALRRKIEAQQADISSLRQGRSGRSILHRAVCGRLATCRSQGPRRKIQSAGAGDSRHIALSGCAANRHQVDCEAVNGGRGDRCGSRKADIANYLAPAPAFAAPRILPCSALNGAASAAISSRYFSQPAKEFSSLCFREHLTESFQGLEEDVRLALANVHACQKIGADHL